MAKSRRKVDNQQVDLDLEDAQDLAIAVPELPEPVVKRKRGRPKKEAEVLPTPQEAPPVALPDPVIEADDVSVAPAAAVSEIVEKSADPPSPVESPVVESPVAEASPPVVVVPEEPLKEDAAAKPTPRREKKPSKPVNPETERFWHLKRMR